MFQDPLECYQAIADELAQIVTEPWQQIDVEVRLIGETSLNTKVTYVNANGDEVGVYDVIMLPRYFFELARLVSTEEKGLYKQCNFSLKEDGKFDVDFDY